MKRSQALATQTNIMYDARLMPEIVDRLSRDELREQIKKQLCGVVDALEVGESIKVIRNADDALAQWTLSWEGPSK